MNKFSEKDWKIFRSKIAGWQEAYMDKLNKEYIEILCGDGKSSEKFWTLEKRIKEDKKDCGVQCEMSRSNQFYIMLSLLNEGAIPLPTGIDEERRVNELDKLLNRFMQNCDPQAVAIAYSSDDKIVCMTQATELERTIDKDFFAISRLLAEDKVLKLDPDNALKVAFAKLYQTVKKDIGDIRQEKIDMCDIHAVGKMAGKLSAERDTFMKEKEEYLESIQSKLRKLLFEEIALEDARKMYN